MFWRHNMLGFSWALLILILCGLPGDQFEKSKLLHADKVVHTVLFGVLFFLLSVGFIKQRRFRQLRNHTLLKVFVISTLYGVIIEALQGLVFLHRSIELSDMLFNTVGSLSGLTLFLLVYGRHSYA